MDAIVTTWPPPYQGWVDSPAGEPASAGWALPSQGSLDYAHKGLQVVFMGLGLVGLVYLLKEGSLRGVAKGAARKHVVS